jgi:TonB family protein
MRLLFVLSLLSLAIALPVGSAQSASHGAPDWTGDPQKMLAAATPLYDYGNPALKPWRLKGSYQLYDDAGKPSEQGTYEYAWRAPKVYRSTWIRPDAGRTEWHTADGKVVYQRTGDRLFFLEHELEKLLFSPLPDPAKLDPAGVTVSIQRLNVGKIKLPCLDLKLRMRSDGTPSVPGSPSGMFCFDPALPVVRIERLYTYLAVEFDHFVKAQDRMLARQITISEGQNKLLTFNVDSLNDLAKDDDSLTPPLDAKVIPSEPITPSAAISSLVKKPQPIYPEPAKAEHISGVVVLDAIIGPDGRVAEMRVLATPSPLLTRAAKDAVSQWQYAPHIVDGQPQEVNTLINVIFSFS